MKFSVITAMILLMTMTGCSQNEAAYRNMTRKAEPEKKITTPSRITHDEIAKISELHNRLRAEVGAEPLSWSNSLASYAQEWSNNIASTRCNLQHRPSTSYGENISMIPIGYSTMTDAVKMWEREKKNYHGEAINTSNWQSFGHYTQMIWRKTRQIGCGKSECNGQTVVVCNYNPAGNIVGEKP